MTCHTEILKCIKLIPINLIEMENYFNQFSDEDLTESVYQAIMYYCKTSQYNKAC